jgi:PKD domain-containing protein
MSARNLLPIALLLLAVSIGCGGGSPTQAEGTVSITRTTTSTTTTTSVIPQLSAGAIGISPTGTGIASATVYSFRFATPPSGGVPPYTLAWDFGDGTAGAGAAPSHAYTNTGNFTATATATDSRGISAQATVVLAIGSVTGRWIATLAGSGLGREPIDLVQNQAAVTAAIDDTNGFGLASGGGNVSNPRLLTISATYTAPPSFAVTYTGSVDDVLGTWTGTVIGYPTCPCTFTAIRTVSPSSLPISPSRR